MNCNKLIFLLVLCINPTLSNQWRADQKQKFLKWKADYKKSYPSSEEETRAMDSMLKNQDQIEAHNKKFAEGKVSFERGLWKRSDLSFDEKQKLLTGSKDLPAEPDKLTLQAAPVNMKSAPSSLDWTKAGRVHAVDDQNICGSCYAFATVGVMEGVLLSKNISTRLSVQQIVDCNQSNEGCGGGEPILSLKYAKINGLASASQYPYTSKEGKCKSYPKLSEIRSVGRVALNGNENRLKVFVANYGPVAVAINAADSLMNYKSGVYNNPKCSKKQDHAVLLVGYGSDSRFGDFWIVKNSWGESWGEGGYVRMARNKKNQCGIASTVWFAS